MMVVSSELLITCLNLLPFSVEDMHTSAPHSNARALAVMLLELRAVWLRRIVIACAGSLVLLSRLSRLDMCRFTNHCSQATLARQGKVTRKTCDVQSR